VAKAAIVNIEHILCLDGPEKMNTGETMKVSLERAKQHVVKDNGCCTRSRTTWRGDLRRLISVNVLDAFITEAYNLVIPLLLVERKIDLATIGLIFSILPLVFVISRFLFAAFADSLGLRSFFNLNAISNSASVAL
jgi:hypothetical protein